MPDKEELQDDSESPEKAEKPEDAATSEDGAAGADAQTGEDTSEDAKPKPKKYGGGFQKRISELTARLRSVEQEKERLFGLVEKAKEPSNEAPKRDEFEDYESYLDARARWAAREEARSLEQKISQDFDKRTKAQAAEQVEAEWEKRQDEARARYEDFDDVAFANDLPITGEMAEAIKLADNGPEIAYYLGKNPDTAERIAKLTGSRAIIEIGRIEERLLTKAKRSGAPEPINPVKSKVSGSPDPLSDKVATDKWMEQRRKQLKR